MEIAFASAVALPADWDQAVLLGRIDSGDGPTPVIVRGGRVYDMSYVAPTVADLVASGNFDTSAGTDLGPLDDLHLSPDQGAKVRLLSPIDLQCVKASGVTFAVSALERVIEERARGDASAAVAVRARLEERVGGSIRSVVPGSPEADALKAALIEDGMWSQYLEVAIGPDA